MYNTDSSYSVPLSKADRWNDEFRNYGIKVSSEVSLCYEVDEFLPRYVFIDHFFSHRSDKPEQTLFGDFTRGGLTFFDRDERPSYPVKDNIDGWRWFAIEPRNFSLVKTYIMEHQPMQVMKHGIEGWIIPLCESEHFENWQDLNAYLHTLMFWESMVKHTEAGPLTERISWLSQNLYHLRNGEQRMAEAMHKNGLCDSLTPVSTIDEMVEKMDKGVQRLHDKHEMELDKLRASLGKDMEKVRDRQILIAKLNELEQQQEAFYREMAERSEMMGSMFRNMYAHYSREMEVVEKQQDERKGNFSTLLNILKQLVEEDDDD